MAIGATIAAVLGGLSEFLGAAAAVQGIIGSVRQKKRTSQETRMRSYFDAIENKLGITVNQIDQFLEDLGYKNTRVTDLIRGTSRTGIANQIYRKILTDYPEIKGEYTKARNSIQGIINNLMSREEQRAAAIQNSKEGEFSRIDVGKEIGQATDQANQIITSLSGNRNSDSSGNIDTSLSTVEKDKKTELQQRAAAGDVSAIGQLVREQYGIDKALNK